MDNLIDIVPTEHRFLPLMELDSSQISAVDSSILKLIETSASLDENVQVSKHGVEFGIQSFSKVQCSLISKYSLASEYTKFQVPGSYEGSIDRLRSANFQTGVEKLTKDGWFRISPRGFYILYGENEKCWQLKDYCETQYAELINTDSLEAKGMVPMKNFTPGTEYEFEFLLRKRPDAALEGKTRFTIVIPLEEDSQGRSKICEVVSCLVDFQKELYHRGWTAVKVCEFTATDDDVFISFSLTNFYPSWKKGLSILGVIIHPKGQ